MSIRSRIKSALAPRDDSEVDWLLSAPFLAVHGALLLLPFLGFSPREATFAAATYGLGMFFVTAGYHRYFAHRAFRTSRVFQFVLALGATATIQRGVLWWAGHHRTHHDRADQSDDVHSPRHGWLWSHVKWFLCNRFDEAPLDRIRDFARFPELVWLERFHFVPGVAVAALALAAGGAQLLVGGYFLGLVVLWHATFSINSIAHLCGSRPYATADDSRNSALLAVLTFGEGWHNNHHFFPSSAAQGFRWWQFDLTYWLLRILALVGLVSDLRRVPERVRARTADAAAEQSGDRACPAA